MVKIKTIKKLYIDKANYLIEDHSGEKVIVVVNYAQGNFKIMGTDKGELLNDIGVFAEDLIKRKSRVNFA